MNPFGSYHNSRTAARLLDALQLLKNEVNSDLLLFKKQAPNAFADAPADSRF